MSRYRFLSPHSIGPYVFGPGDVETTSDVGGLLAANFVPSANCDPLDPAGVAAFYAAGPQTRQRWTGPSVAAATFWKSTPQPSNPSVMLWQLTGLGAALAPIFTQAGVGAPA